MSALNLRHIYTLLENFTTDMVIYVICSNFNQLFTINSSQSTLLFQTKPAILPISTFFTILSISRRLYRFKSPLFELLQNNLSLNSENLCIICIKVDNRLPLLAVSSSYWRLVRLNFSRFCKRFCGFSVRYNVARLVSSSWPGLSLGALSRCGLYVFTALLRGGYRVWYIFRLFLIFQTYRSIYR
jgi:hypothetical protein